CWLSSGPGSPPRGSTSARGLGGRPIPAVAWRPALDDHRPPSPMTTTILPPPPTDVHVVLREMRRTRRTRRVKGLEWFEVLYQVYLVAIIGGGMVLWASSYVKDGSLDASTLA